MAVGKSHWAHLVYVIWAGHRNQMIYIKFKLDNFLSDQTDYIIFVMGKGIQGYVPLLILNDVAQSFVYSVTCCYTWSTNHTLTTLWEKTGIYCFLSSLCNTSLVVSTCVLFRASSAWNLFANIRHIKIDFPLRSH